MALRVLWRVYCLKVSDVYEYLFTWKKYKIDI